MIVILFLEFEFLSCILEKDFRKFYDIPYNLPGIEFCCITELQLSYKIYWEYYYEIHTYDINYIGFSKGCDAHLYPRNGSMI